jgi:hypothetical protein
MRPVQAPIVAPRQPRHEEPRQAAALVSAVVYIAAAPLELFFISGPGSATCSPA